MDCRVEAKLEHWYITGLRQQDTVPSLVASIGDTTSSLLKIEFETNPENSTADQTLVVRSQPVEVIYDAVSAKKKCIFIKPILYIWHFLFCFLSYVIFIYLELSLQISFLKSSSCLAVNFDTFMCYRFFSNVRSICLCLCQILKKSNILLKKSVFIVPTTPSHYTLTSHSSLFLFSLLFSLIFGTNSKSFRNNRKNFKYCSHEIKTSVFRCYWKFWLRFCIYSFICYSESYLISS